MTGTTVRRLMALVVAAGGLIIPSMPAQSAAAACTPRDVIADKQQAGDQIGREVAQLARAGASQHAVNQALQRDWCLQPLSTSAAPQGVQSIPDEETGTQPWVWFDSTSLYYDSAANDYVAMANYSWHTNGYIGEESERLCSADNVGDLDGLGIRVTNGDFTFISSSATIWGNPEYDDRHGNDFGIYAMKNSVGRSGPGVPNEYGATYKFQDRTVALENNGGGCLGFDPANYLQDYSAYGGLIIYRFDKVNGDCKESQAFAVYGHSYEEVDINGFSAGPWSFGASWNVTGRSWEVGDASPAVMMCPNGSGSGSGRAPAGNTVLAAPQWIMDLSDSGGNLMPPQVPRKKAAPAMAFDKGDGSSMEINRWVSNGSAFGGLATYTSGTFYLSRVGNRIASGDVDGDGDDDTVMAYQNDNGTFSFYVWDNELHTGKVWYTSPGSYSLSTVQGRLVLGDFNGDKKAEPAMAYEKGDGSTMSIDRWLSTGSSFGSRAVYNSGTFYLSRVGDRMAAGDVNGDGRDDIVMAHQNANGTFSFYRWDNELHTGSVWYTSGSYTLSNVQGRLVLGDFNGDDRAEPAMAYSRGDGSSMYIHRWLSTGSSFGSLATYTSGTFYLSKVGDRMAAGDVDGDGDDDIVMAYQNDNGTFSFYRWDNELHTGSVWYTSGSYTLNNVQGRLVLGRW